MKRLTLLSGGEKSMTALAFLFAVFLAKPCPFYIMDEVEAALDDLNISRFLDLLDTYNDRAQFIVVTHQKRTMEAADSLYGVSMGGDGISKVISRRLPAREAAASFVTREWSDLFIADHAAARRPAPGGRGGRREKRRGMFSRLRENLRKTRQALGAEIQATLFEEVNDETWERLEEALIYADVGARTTAQVVGQLEREATEGGIVGGEALTERLTELLADIARVGDDHIDLRAKPTVILMAGVNGTGKTTTTGKLAHHLSRELGYSVVLAAADTFRAAAVEQLGVWAERAGATFVRGPDGTDPAPSRTRVSRPRSRDGADVVIVDTAGRLHTQDDLMGELTKIRRVISKQIPDAPHETLLTVDATTGQNGLRQAQLFSQAIEVSGLVLTKLDGTAKGGIALAIAGELGIPVKLIGIGEQLDDLRPFDADFAARS